MTTTRVRGLTDLDPLPKLPRYAAAAGMSAWLLALGVGEPLATDPHRVLKMNNFDRLCFDRMPVLCSGPRPLQVGRSWEMRPLVLAEVADVAEQPGTGSAVAAAWAAAR
jgi:hypothetical protein